MSAEQSKAKSPEFTRRRRRVEGAIKRQLVDLSQLSAEDIQRLMQELQVHQIELEMQNEELRRAQQELQESRYQYTDLYDFAPVGYFTLDNKGFIVAVNLTGATQLGVSRDKLIKQSFTAYIAPESQDIFYWHRRRVLQQSGLRQPCEIQLVKSDGTRFWGQLESVQVQNNAGQPSQFRTALIDISERKRAEAGLQTAHEALEIQVAERTAELLKAVAKLEEQITERNQTQAALMQERNFVSAILDTASALVVVLDTQGRIVRFNRTCEQITGYTFDETRNQFIWDLVLPLEEVEAVRAVFEQLQAGHFPNEYENHWVVRDGSRHLIAWSNTVLLDREGLVEYIIGIGIDITKHKQAEATLAEERNLLRTLIDNLPVYIFVKDTHSRFMLNNMAHVRLIGATRPDEVIGKTDFDVFPQELAAQYYADEQRVIQTGQPLTNREERAIDPQGQQQWLFTTKVPLRDSQGKVMGLVGISQDITERKQAEDERVRLFGAVNQQRQQLRALTARLAEAQEAERKQLARELHDQVGQNLTALGLNLNIILAQLAETPLEISTIQSRLRDSLALVEQTTVRIRDVMAHLRPPVLDDYGLVAALRWYGVQVAPRVDFTITVWGSEPTPRLATPVENALFRIAQEALTNVAKHAQATQATVVVEVDRDTMRLIVADNGHGFEPAHSAEPPGQQGWGLLSMTERAEAVGGRCWVDSQPGQGTRIIIEVSR